MALRFAKEGAKSIICADIDAAGAAKTASEVNGVSLVMDAAKEVDIANVLDTEEKTDLLIFSVPTQGFRSVVALRCPMKAGKKYGCKPDVPCLGCTHLVPVCPNAAADIC